MKNLYETLLDRDYEVSGNSLVLGALASDIASFSHINAKDISIQLSNDGRACIFELSNDRASMNINGNKFFELVSQLPAWRFEFKCDVFFIFPQDCDVKDIIIETEKSIDFGTVKKVSFNNCIIDSGYPIYFGGPGGKYKVQNSELRVGSLEVRNCDLTLVHCSADMLNDLQVSEPSIIQRHWIKKQGLPMCEEDIYDYRPAYNQFQRKDINPFDILGLKSGIDHVNNILIRGPKQHDEYILYEFIRYPRLENPKPILTPRGAMTIKKTPIPNDWWLIISRDN